MNLESNDSVGLSIYCIDRENMMQECKNILGILVIRGFDRTNSGRNNIWTRRKLGDL